MSKSRVGVLYMLSLELALISAILLLLSLVIFHPLVPSAVGEKPIWLLPGLILAVTAFALGTTAWMGALVNVARLRRWGWVVALLLLLDLPMIVYLFAGPEGPQAS